MFEADSVPFPPQPFFCALQSRVVKVLSFTLVILFYGVCVNLPTHVHQSNLTSTFTSVYSSHLWGELGRGSGPGSNIINAQGAARVLYHVTISINATSLIDAPCGGMEWQPHVLWQLKHAIPSFRFLGVDVVPDVVADDRRISDRPLPVLPPEPLDMVPVEFMHFEVKDLTVTPLPNGYDLIMSRDSFQHNSFEGVFAMLRNMAASNARYLLLQSYTAQNRKRAREQGWPGPLDASWYGNHDIITGRFFMVDLAEPPFSLIPDAIFDENYAFKAFYLYRGANFARMLRHSYSAFRDADVTPTHSNTRTALERQASRHSVSV